MGSPESVLRIGGGGVRPGILSGLIAKGGAVPCGAASPVVLAGRRSLTAAVACGPLERAAQLFNPQAVRATQADRHGGADSGRFFGACVFYWVQTRYAPPSIDDLLPTYERERTRNVGIMSRGPLGVMMLGWTQALESPATQAIIIAAISACVALVCRRLAWVMDQNERTRARRPEKSESRP